MKTDLYRVVNSHCPSIPKSPFLRPLDPPWKQQRVPAWTGRGSSDSEDDTGSPGQGLTESISANSTVSAQRSHPRVPTPPSSTLSGCPYWHLESFCPNCCVLNVSLPEIPLRWKESDDLSRVFAYLLLLLTHVLLFATPWTAAHKASLSLTISQRWLKLVFMESVMPSNHLALCGPLSPSFTASHLTRHPGTEALKGSLWEATSKARGSDSCDL